MDAENFEVSVDEESCNSETELAETINAIRVFGEDDTEVQKIKKKKKVKKKPKGSLKPSN